jgi:hypothetical protein
LRDEYLNEHWFTTLAHARTVIEEWRRDYNEQRPKKGSGRDAPGRLRGSPAFASELRRKRIGYSLPRWTLNQTSTKLRGHVGASAFRAAAYGLKIVTRLIEPIFQDT